MRAQTMTGTQWRAVTGVWLVLLVGALAKHIPRQQPAEAPRPGPGDGQHMWLEDYERLSEDMALPEQMQADAPPPAKLNAQPGCPPLDPDASCEDLDVVKCVGDADCSEDQGKCCYNPCTNGNTCRKASIVLDWVREPKRQHNDHSWLVATNENYYYEYDADWCSTTPPDEDEDALLCPHGFRCEVEFAGDPQEGVPNRGRCVPDAAQQQRSNEANVERETLFAE